ncbi:DUF541 domain-containing protein [bacterium]|jgi:uncharacterized protein YggE|nr:DUF541 domain-containing protein [bacterium]
MSRRSLALIFILPVASVIADPAQALDRRVTMGGECNLEVEPDRASVVFIAENQSQDAKSAIQKATSLHEKLRSRLKASKIADLELSSVEYSVQEVTAWENNRNVSKGYSCRIGLKAVTRDAKALGDVIAIAADAGIQNTHGMQMYLSDERSLEEKKKCIAIAVKNAREKAEQAVKALGARLGPVESISERGASSTGPVPMAREAFALKGSAMAAPVLDAPRQAVHHEVDATFSIEL